LVLVGLSEGTPLSPTHRVGFAIAPKASRGADDFVVTYQAQNWNWVVLWSPKSCHAMRFSGVIRGALDVVEAQIFNGLISPNR
jgi:hypothetical protein